MHLVLHLVGEKRYPACIDEVNSLFHRLAPTDAVMAAVIAAAPPQERGTERLVDLPDDASTGRSA